MIKKKQTISSNIDRVIAIYNLKKKDFRSLTVCSTRKGTRLLRKFGRKPHFSFRHNSAHKALGRTHLINRPIALVLDNGLASSGHALD